MSVELGSQRTYRAACLTSSHAPLEIVHVDFPKFLLEKQVFVKNIFSSICGSQLGEIAAKKGPDMYLPHLLGHEAVSEVLATGDKVTEVKIGDMVILHWMKGRGGQAIDHSVRSGGRKINAGPITTFADYSVVSENRCTPIRTNLPTHLLPLYGCSVTTAHGALRNDLGIKPEDRLLVLGLGPLGMFSLELSKIFGVEEVFGVDLNMEKVDKAGIMGFRGCMWDFKGDTPESLADFVKKQTNGRLVIVETTGSVRAIEGAYEFLGTRGKMVLIGVSSYGERITLDPTPLHFGREIVGSFGGQTVPQDDIPMLVKLAEEKAFNLNVLDHELFDLADINYAIERIRRGSPKKKILSFKRS